MTANDKHFMRHWCDEDVSGMHLEMKKTVRMEKSDSLACVPKVADQSGKRHAGRFVLFIVQPSGLGGFDVRLREEWPAVSGCTQVVNRNEIGVAKPGPNLSPLKKPVIVLWTVGTIDDDFPPQRLVEGEPTAMWAIEPQLIAQFVPFSKRTVRLHDASRPLFFKARLSALPG